MDNSAGKKPVILLVEGDASHQDLVRNTFEQQDVSTELHIVSDGSEALDYLFRKGKYADAADAPAPHLVLLDLTMPDRSGLETLAAIRADERTKTLPVVVLTTSDNDADIIRSYELGANSFIIKPIKFDEFVKVICELDEYWFGLIRAPSARSA